VNPEAGLSFGTTCDGATTFLNLEVFNVGTSDLVITSVQRLMGSTGFAALANPGPPSSRSPANTSTSPSPSRRPRSA
jgi:hypothetical protein